MKYTEAAYIGDHEIDEAVIQAANRGLKVNIVISKQANIGNDNNYRRAEKIMREMKGARNFSFRK